MLQRNAFAPLKQIFFVILLTVHLCVVRAGETDVLVDCRKKDFIGDSPCPQDYTNTEGAGSCLYFEENSPLSWHDAKARCEKVGRGGSLVTIKTTGKAEALKAKVSTSKQEFWIGLNDARKNKQLRWIDDNKEPNSGIVKWDTDEPMLSITRTCIKRRSHTKMFAAEKCSKALAYVCQTNYDVSRYKPRLKLEFDEQPNVLYGGNIKTVVCKAKVGNTGNLRLTQDKNYKNKTMDRSSPSIFLQADREYIKVNGKCERYTEAHFKFQVSKDITGNFFICCITWTHKIQLCSERTPKAAIKYIPKPPDLDVEYNQGKPFVAFMTDWSATCTAYIGDNGHLSWILQRPTSKQPIIRVLNSNGQIHGSEAGDAKGLQLSFSSTFSNTFGTQLSSTLNVTIDSTAMTGSIIACYTGDASGAASMPYGDLVVMSTPMITYFLPGTPSLEINYIYPPYVMKGDQLLVASCQAETGTRGILTWVIESKNDTLVFSLLENIAVVYSEGDYSPGFDISPNDTFVKAKMSSTEYSIVLNSTIYLNVTEELEGGSISCYSTDVDNMERTESRFYKAESPALQIFYPPGRARLKALSRRHLHDGETFSAKCSAHVGTRGVMLWHINSTNGITQVVDFTHGPQRFLPKGVKITGLKYFKDEEYGPHIESQINIKMSPMWDHIEVTCYPHDIENMTLPRMVYSWVIPSIAAKASRTIAPNDNYWWLILAIIASALTISLLGYTLLKRQKARRMLAESHEPKVVWTRNEADDDSVPYSPDSVRERYNAG